VCFVVDLSKEKGADADDDAGDQDPSGPREDDLADAAIASTTPENETPPTPTQEPQTQQLFGVRRAQARPPSYTDRILVHSLQDREGRLSLEAYDSTDAIILSDHRPVALTSILNVSQERATRSSSVWVRVVFTSAIADPPFEGAIRSALYSTPYYTASVAGKPNKKVAPIVEEEEEGEEKTNKRKQTVDSSRNGSLGSFPRRRNIGSFSGSSPRRHRNSSDETLVGFFDQSETVEMVFPLPSEDPLLEQRTLAEAAQEGIAVGRKAKKEKNQVFARAGAAAAAGAAAGEGLTQAAGTVALKRSQVLSSTSRVQIEEFAGDLKAIETVSEVTPGLGMHAVLKFVCKNGNVLGQASLCLAAVVRAHMLNAHDAESASTGLATGLAKAPTPVEVEVVVSAGGKRLGKVVVAVTCEKVTRIV
jgi:hypothetical protein